VTGSEVVETDDDNFKEREECQTGNSSRVSEKVFNETEPKEGGEKKIETQDKVSESMHLKNIYKEGAVKVGESSEGKDKPAQKAEDIEVAIEKIVGEKENKANLDGGAVEKERREKIYEEGDYDEIKEVKGKSKYLNKGRDGRLVKDEDNKNGKIILEVEIGNDIVEKKVTEKSIGKANMEPVENVNKRERSENGLAIEKVETEQAEGDKAMAEVRKREKEEKSDRIVKRADEPEVAAREEINISVYNNGELAFNIYHRIYRCIHADYCLYLAPKINHSTLLYNAWSVLYEV